MTTTDSVHPTHRDLWSGLSCDDLDAEVGVLGVPFDGAVSFRRGAAFAPARLRELSTHLAPCAEEGQPLSVRVRDYGDVPADEERFPEPFDGAQDRLVEGWPRYFYTVEEQAAKVLQHRLALFLGGDHSVTIPLMRAFDRAVNVPFGVVHFDAHPDLFNVYHGRRWSHACTARRALELPGLDPRHLVFVGLCSFAREEWGFLRAHPEIT
jgi:agmatinase